MISKDASGNIKVIRHINQEFIKHGVKFVIQVGDLTDKPSTVVTNPARVENLDIRATFAQDLYNAGIGFYPLRGNHEDKPSTTGLTGLPADFAGSYAREFQRIFPQTQTGINNLTPVDAMITTTIYGPQANTYSKPLILGTNFASEPSMSGLTYSFDYDNARFVLIDQFTKPDGTSHSNLDQNDVNWVGLQLSTRPANTHAFVFAHKGLITENHNDNLFNSTNPDTNPLVTWPLTNSYMSYLANSGVRYHIGGHDHMHNRAVVTSPDGNSKVQNIIAASNSYKFYIPPAMATFNAQTWRPRETQIAQELFTVGYYIFTVDGPRVTVDHYAMPNGCNDDCDQTYDVIPYDGNTPTSLYADPVTFTKRETFGYSLNGIEKLVPQGASYVLTDDTSKAVADDEARKHHQHKGEVGRGQAEEARHHGYVGTTAAILSGTNGSTSKDFNLRPLTKSVNTGWAPKDQDLLESDILTLWGMADSLATKLDPSGAAPHYNYEYAVPNTTLTDTYVLSMAYKPGHSERLGNGGFGIAAKDANGNWVNAVDNNTGGTKKFVKGPWKASYDLGTYGVDASTKTAWAVINFDGSFAVADRFEQEPDHRR